jgi:hypothetical protein
MSSKQMYDNTLYSPSRPMRGNCPRRECAGPALPLRGWGLAQVLYGMQGTHIYIHTYIYIYIYIYIYGLVQVLYGMQGTQTGHSGLSLAS